MGFVDKIAGLFTGGGGRAAHSFQCTSCKATFGAHTDDKTQVRCPQCGGEIVRSVPEH